MTLRRYARALVALLAAYAVALQIIVLAAGSPAAGVAGLSSLPICSPLGAGNSDPAPAGHGHDCLAACLVGCSGNPHLLPPPAAAVIYGPQPARMIAASVDATVPLRFGPTGAHRSRAPPVA
jgi:hypothetical protein